MMIRKKIRQNFLVLGIPLLAVAMLISWLKFQDPSKQASGWHTTRNSENASLSNGLPQTPPVMQATNLSDAQGVRPTVCSVSKMAPLTESSYEVRSEMREISVSIRDLYSTDSTAPPESLHLPLFDDKFVELKALRHQSMGKEQGVVFAKVDGEVEGGHVLLSYVGTALAGMIHRPSRKEFYEIRTAPDGRSHILTQLDPEKMGRCAGCAQHLTK